MHSVDLKKTSTSVRTIRFDDGRLKIEDIVDIAEGSASVALSEASQFRSAIARGAAFLDRLLREEGTIYGVSRDAPTGSGLYFCCFAEICAD
jgi:histidine ammonia-lyase